MKILICDDQPYYVEKLEKLVREYGENNKEDYEIRTVNNFMDKGNFNPDLIFLDVEMPGKSGIEIKKELEANHSRSLIIFVTNYIENVYDAFGMNVIGFLPKPLDYMTLDLLMKKVNNILIGRQIVELEPAVCVRVDDIRYIEMDGNYSDVIFAKGFREKHRIVRRTLSQWKEVLPKYYFMDINKSCIVHCGHISKYSPGEVIMDEDGERLTISRRHKAQCAEEYRKYVIMITRYGR